MGELKGGRIEFILLSLLWFQGLVQ